MRGQDAQIVPPYSNALFSSQTNWVVISTKQGEYSSQAHWNFVENKETADKRANDARSAHVSFLSPSLTFLPHRSSVSQARNLVFYPFQIAHPILHSPCRWLLMPVPGYSIPETIRWLLPPLAQLHVSTLTSPSSPTHFCYGSY